jgi:hypothetical protein
MMEDGETRSSSMLCPFLTRLVLPLSQYQAMLSFHVGKHLKQDQVQMVAT